MTSVTEYRLALQAAGFDPTACNGKNAQVTGWNAPHSEEEITAWAVQYPNWTNTGIRTRNTPTFDLDIRHPEAAAAAEELIRSLYDDHGTLLARIGMAPKRALLFRTTQPFRKIRVNFADLHGNEHHIEVLGDGQQVVVDGIHPDTHKPYAWPGGYRPGGVAWQDLPEIDEEAARSLTSLISEMLCEKFGFRRVEQNGHGANVAPARGESFGPVDAVAELEGLANTGTGGASVNAALTRVIPSMLHHGIHPDEVQTACADAVMAMAKRLGLDWDREKELNFTAARILSAYQNLLLKEYDHTTGEIPRWLPEEFHARWAEILVAGGRPIIGRNRYGFFVKTMPTYGAKDAPGREAPEEPKGEEPPHRRPRFKFTPFCELRPGNAEAPYLIDELIPAKGIVLVWGPPKCLKSFLMFTAMFYVAKGWEYRDRAVLQGPVMYCAFEGSHGYTKRGEALRRHYKLDEDDPAPLIVMSGKADLVRDHALLVAEISAHLAGVHPVAVVLDTLNKSLVGSESKDLDMAAYIRAAEAVRDAFDCVVIVVHHCGWDESRMRGHSSLRGAVDTEISITREGDVVTATVEEMRDGPDGVEIVSRCQVVDVGIDKGGRPLTSLVIVPHEPDGNEPRGQGKGRWAPGLKTLKDAIVEALLTAGIDYQIEGGPRVKAVDLEKVRDAFYASCPVVSGEDVSVEQRQDSRRRAFARSIDRARAHHLIGARVLPNGQQLVWLAQPENRYAI